MKENSLTKKSIGAKVAFGFTFIVFLLYALTIIYTLFWLFTNSLKTIDEWDASKFSLPMEFIKSGLLFDNYISDNALVSGVGCDNIHATEKAIDYLVKKGMPFRDAYKITGQLVALCISRSLTLETLPLDEYKQYTDIFDEDVYTAINLETCVNQRNSEGGPSPSAVKVQIEKTLEQLKKVEADD